MLAVHGHQGATEVRWLGDADTEPRPELDLDPLFGGRHNVRPPTSIADPAGLPSAHAKGWAGARHLR